MVRAAIMDDIYFYVNAMARKKLERFKEVHASPYIVEEGFDDVKNSVQSFIGLNGVDIVLELGCGKGEYTISLAQKNPHKKYIGIDIQGERLWYGAQKIEAHALSNVLFVRCYIENIEKFFSPKSIQEIWITFPDPFPQEARAKKRLTHERFLNMYKVLLVENGIIHLKTDSNALFTWSLESFKKNNWIVKSASDYIDTDIRDLPEEVFTTQTEFEKKFRKKGVPITYLCVQKEVKKL